MDKLLSDINIIYNRLNNINQLVGMLKNDNLVCEIGQFIFILKGKFFDNSGRECIHIVSRDKETNEENELVFYRSNSEFGLWRFAVRNNENSRYHKGSNYITSTFVHIQLQIYINKNIDSIIEYDKENAKLIYEKIVVRRVIKGQQLHTEIDNRVLYIDNKNRYYKNKYFEFLDLCEPGQCFTQKVIYEMINKININSEEYEKYFNNHFKKNCQNKFTKDISGRLYTNSKHNVRCFYEIISKFMDNYFKITTNQPTFLIKYHIKIPSLEINSEVQLYQILIREKGTDINYELIYMIYKFRNKEYKSIVNIIPPGSEINKYGIYDKIISAGIYIYKPFEYIKQLDVNDKKKKYGSELEYFFLGNLMTNVWPLNKLKPTN